MPHNMIGLKNDHSPSTKKFIEHLSKGELHLIPKAEDIVKKQMELIIDYLFENTSDPDHEDIYLQLVSKTHKELNEWLRIQIHNLRVADEIRREV